MSSTGKSYIGQSPADAAISSSDLGSGIVTAPKVAASIYGFSMVNGQLAFSVASSALTIAIKTLAGTDPTTSDPVYIMMRSATAATADYTMITVSAANSLVISSGSTMGATNSIAFRLWIVGFNDAGTFRLGAINCLTTVAGAGAGRDVTAIYPLSAWGIASSTAEGGAGASDSAQTFYTGTAVTSKPYIVLGYATYESGLATVGTWSAVPTRGQLYAPSITPLPGQTVQVQISQDGAQANGTTTLPWDDTIPQSAEGFQFMTQAITPSSAANALRVRHAGEYAHITGGDVNVTAMYQDATANAICGIGYYGVTADQPFLVQLEHILLAGTTSATTMKIRTGTNAGFTVTFNGTASARKLGGTSGSYLTIEELMG